MSDLHKAALAQQADKPQRPKCFEFALDFLGTPENGELLAYIEQLEARAALAHQAEPKGGGRLPPPLQAEPAQEPVAWYQKRGQEVLTSHPACWGREDEPWTPLYTAPPQRKPLTEEEIDKIVERLCNTVGASCKTMTRAVERAHGIKE
jgi:hypothetical protein